MLDPNIALQQAAAEAVAQPQDPLQQQQTKFTFAGREFGSLAEAETAARTAFAQKDQELRTIAAEKERLEAQLKSQGPAPSQMETGKAPQYNHEEYMRLVGTDGREATRYAMRMALADTGLNLPQNVDPLALVQAAIQVTIQNNRTLEDQQLRNGHPEVEWHKPEVVKAIEDTRQRLGLADSAQARHMAILELQRFRQIPNLQDYEAWRAGQAAPQPQQSHQGNLRPFPVSPPPSIPQGGAPTGFPTDTSEIERIMSGMTLEQQLKFEQAFRQKLAAG